MGTKVFDTSTVSAIENTLIPSLVTDADSIRDKINTAIDGSPPASREHNAVRQAIAAHASITRAIQALRGVVLHNEDDYSNSTI